ncbi:ATP-binding protein [Sulfitobacter sp. JB4-11]|uniref:ATP-binding protein n=1 Tax=Sulfitobacter rhodophyticola TaxID=3238304 RepID=UPI003D813F8C
MRLFAVAQVCGLLGVLSGGLLGAVQALAQAQTDAPVRFAYHEFAPYSFTGADGTAQGLAIDLARRLAEADGRTLNAVRASNPAGVIDMLARGEADVSNLLGQTDARAELAPYTSALGTFRTLLFAKKDGTERRVEDFAGRRIGAVSGSVGMKVVKLVPDAQVVPIGSLDQLIMAMMTEQVDAIVAPANGLQSRLRLMGIDPLVDAIEPALAEFPLVFYVSPQRPDLLAAFNAEINGNLTPAEISAFYDIWFGTPTRIIEREIILWGSFLLAIFASGAVIAMRRSMSHARTVKRLGKETEENRLLVDALDGVEAAIAIFDDNFRTVHWNKGFSRAFPEMIGSMKKGGSLREMVTESFVSGNMSEAKSPDEARRMTDNLLVKLKAGHTMRRMLKGTHGQVFEAADFRVGAKHYASVRVDMSNLYDQAQLISSQNVRLETSNKKLEHFTMLVAHDLKAPLQQQTGLLEFLEEDLQASCHALPDEVLENMGVMQTLSRRMTQLVEDLLDHATADEQSLFPVFVNIADRLKAILPLAALRVGFRVDIAPDIPDILVDPTALDAVLRNLISNAVKHHDRAEGVICIRGHVDGETIVIEVADDGPGIPEKYRKRIFEPFERLSAKREGSGLGLSFLKKTVSAWGGEVSVSCPPGQGSVFRFTVPRVPPAILQARAAQTTVAKLY